MIILRDKVIRFFKFKFKDYLEAGESKYVSLMMRHQTLYESNFDTQKSIINMKMNKLKLNLEKQLYREKF